MLQRCTAELLRKKSNPLFLNNRKAKEKEAANLMILSTTTTKVANYLRVIYTDEFR